MPSFADTQKTPYPTVDIIIEIEGKGIVMVKRKHPPYGWALPGGFVDVGESLEEAAVREAREETSLKVTLVRQMHAYSDPKRDDRGHNITVVFLATAEGRPHGGSDAEKAQVITPKELAAMTLAFDHRSILNDYFAWKEKGFKVFDL